MDPSPLCQRLASVVEPFPCLIWRDVSKQHHELVTAMPSEVTIVVRNIRERFRDHLQDVIPDLMPICVVDPFEIIDVAECNDQVLNGLARFFAVPVIKGFEGAPGRSVR